jgi:heat shock protein beta
MIRKLAEEGQNDDDEEADAAEADSEEESKYDKFWKAFGKAIKLGIIEDASNRTRLAKLMRFYTSKSPEKLVSLEQYVERMKPGQKTIYYLAGESREALEKSPFLERLLAKDLEVIYFTDPIDEYTMQNLTEFDEYKFSNASKEDLKFGDADDAEKKRNKKIREMFKDFTKWWKDVLPSDEVENVKISNRLVTTPCSVVTSKYGWSANMERIMKAQALSDDSRASYMRGKKTLEINPRHPLIKTLRERSIEDPESEETKELATVLYETAMLESGFAFDQPADFAGRLFSLVRKNMGIDENAELDAEDADIEDEEEAAEDAEKGKDEL